MTNVFIFEKYFLISVLDLRSLVSLVEDSQFPCFYYTTVCACQLASA